MSPSAIGAAVRESYLDEAHNGVLCVAAGWDSFSVDDTACIAAGLGATALAHICALLCRDYGYWAGGLPDLVLWKWEAAGEGQDGDVVPADAQPALRACTKLVEVKSQRDTLSSRQRAWLSELLDAHADVEVFKVVERETRRNVDRLLDADLDAAQLGVLDLDVIGSADDGRSSGGAGPGAYGDDDGGEDDDDDDRD
jgi:hypothetical protein